MSWGAMGGGGVPSEATEVTGGYRVVAAAADRLSKELGPSIISARRVASSMLGASTADRP